jgi:hypothetical protein
MTSSGTLQTWLKHQENRENAVCVDISRKNKRVPRETKVNLLWKCHEVHYGIATGTDARNIYNKGTKKDREEEWSLVM